MVIYCTTSTGLMLVLLFVVYKSSYASYVIYNTNTSNERYVGSVPYQESGFSYSDGQGNSISYTTTRSLPVIINQYPGAHWIYVKGDKLPFNTVVYGYVNGRAVYYCRVEQGNKLLHGQLVPNQGCFVNGYSNRPYVTFQVLVR